MRIEPPPSPIAATKPLASDLGSAGGCLLGVVFVIGLCVAGWFAADNGGWVQHNHDTPVLMGANWITGEFRTCSMMARYHNPLREVPVDDRVLTCQTGLSEQSNPLHILPVRYHGRLIRDEDDGKDFISWNCQRTEDALDCKALD